MKTKTRIHFIAEASPSKVEDCIETIESDLENGYGYKYLKETIVEEKPSVLIPISLLENLSGFIDVVRFENGEHVDPLNLEAEVNKLIPEKKKDEENKKARIKYQFMHTNKYKESFEQWVLGLPLQTLTDELKEQIAEEYRATFE